MDLCPGEQAEVRNRKKLKAKLKSTGEHVALAEKNCSTVDLWLDEV